MSNPWSTAGGANSRRGFFDGRVEIAGRPARVLPAGGALHAAVIFDAADRAFVADMSGGVRAFTRAGVLAWQQRLQGGISATPALSSDAGTLFAGTHAGYVYAVDTDNGSVKWKAEVPTNADPRILSDLLFLPKRSSVALSSWGGRFVELEAAGGKELRTWDAGISPCSGAAADAGENIYCLRAVRDIGVQLVRAGLDGKESVLQQADESGGPANRSLVSAAPVLDLQRKLLYFVTNSGRGGTLRALALQEESLLWTRRVSAVAATPAVSGDGRVAAADMGGFVHVIEPDGTLVYRYDCGSDYLLAGTVCDGSGTLFVPDPLGMVHVIPRDGVGGPIFELPRSAQARPSFDSRGNLYVPGTDHHVYVFGNNAAAEK